ncbi:SDR family NAD(P)-dependent oxidoreductase [Pedobacter sp. L105]|uniref:SDR family NAD(P)-dependent oxidoreductase n=1 Tax=Pedobacter sp. L105 TaxID=1641871 RepID=UPI00131D8E26|nr:SDR family oxidoreductase [Pedobacter sp. L105]
MKKLENKVAVVTGGNSGIGLAAAVLFAEQGAKVAVTGRDQQTLDSAVKEIGHEAIGIIGDVSTVSQIEATYKKTAETFGKIDVLVINAGVFIPGALADFTEEEFDKTSDINFKGVFFSVQKALPYLNDGASVVITSSALATMGLGGTSVYSATKGAVITLAKAFSIELAGRNIRVNILSPGPIVTPIMTRDGATPEQFEKAKSGMASKTVVGRMGNSEEIAQGFLYLASDDSRFMLGGELLLDGGMRIKS